MHQVPFREVGIYGKTAECDSDYYVGSLASKAFSLVWPTVKNQIQLPEVPWSIRDQVTFWILFIKLDAYSNHERRKLRRIGTVEISLPRKHNVFFTNRIRSKISHIMGCCNKIEKMLSNLTTEFCNDCSIMYLSGDLNGGSTKAAGSYPQILTERPKLT